MAPESGRFAATPATDRTAQVLRRTGTLVARARRPLLSRGYVQLLTRALPGREIEITDQSGHLQVIDTRDQMGANALVGRYRLPDDVVVRIRAGDWAIDCGANIGIITSQLCAAVGQEGLVWACEPVPENVRRLERLRSANRLGQLRVIASAIGATPGTAMIGLPPPGRSGWASMTKSFGVSRHVEVPVDTLDGLAGAAPPGRRVAFVKLDVEGYEPEVVSGATRLLGEDAPIVFCEFNDVLLRDRGQSSRQLLEQFADLGYRPGSGSAAFVSRLEGQVVNLLLVPTSARGRVG